MMDPEEELPGFDERFPDLNEFILKLVDEYNTAQMKCWDDLEARVNAFFTLQKMDDMEARVPHWRKMTSYLDGVTLVHVMCVFTGLYMMPEFLRLTEKQQQMMKWVILLHDVEKEPQRGKRDHAHAFRSAVNAAQILPVCGFPVLEEYESLIEEWSTFALSATIQLGHSSEILQDNSKLPMILEGIERMFGTNTSSTLLIKTILLHLSVNMELWPPPNPLTDEEIKAYFDSDLAATLLVMNLGDNDGWALFNPEVRRRQRADIVNQFEKIERLLSSEG